MVQKQETRHLAVNTPLGKDVLALTAFRGQEEMSRLFSYRLEMISERETISAAEIVGKNVTVSIESEGSTRYFNGFINRFTSDYGGGDEAVFHAEMVP